MVKKNKPRENPMKRKKDSPSKTTLVKKYTSQKSHVSKRKSVEKVNKRIEHKTAEKKSLKKIIMSSRRCLEVEVCVSNKN